MGYLLPKNVFYLLNEVLSIPFMGYMVIGKNGEVLVDSTGKIVNPKAGTVGTYTQTDGLQEAINYLNTTGGGLIVVKEGTYTLNYQIPNNTLQYPIMLVGKLSIPFMGYEAIISTTYPNYLLCYPFNSLYGILFPQLAEWKAFYHFFQFPLWDTLRKLPT